jgi:hypothetical protein
MDDLSALQLDRIARATERDRMLIAARWGGDQGMEQPADKIAALIDATRALEEANAAYALIGGVAVGIHTGTPRATLDTDIAEPSTMARETIISAMQRAGFRLVREFEHSLNFRHSGGEPVQLAIDPSFDAMIDRAETLRVESRTIRIVRKGDLIEMKRRAAADPTRRRSKALRDEADVALLLGDVPDPDEGW